MLVEGRQMDEEEAAEGEVEEGEYLGVAVKAQRIVVGKIHR